MLKIIALSAFAFLASFFGFLAIQKFFPSIFFQSGIAHAILLFLLAAINFRIFHITYNAYKKHKNIRLFIVALAFYVYGFSFLHHAILMPLSFSETSSEIVVQYGLFLGTLIFVAGLALPLEEFSDIVYKNKFRILLMLAFLFVGSSLFWLLAPEITATFEHSANAFNLATGILLFILIVSFLGRTKEFKNPLLFYTTIGLAILLAFAVTPFFDYDEWNLIWWYSHFIFFIAFTLIFIGIARGQAKEDGLITLFKSPLFTQTKIRIRLTVSFLLVALIPTVIIGYLNYNYISNFLEKNILKSIGEVADLKINELKKFTDDVKSQISIAQNLINVRKHFPTIVQYFEDKKNQNFIEAKAALDQELITIKKTLAKEDIILLNLKGEIVYVADQEHEQEYLGKSLFDSRDAAFENGKKGIYFSEFFKHKHAASIGDDFDMLITAPIFNLNEKLVGVMAFEIDITTVYNVVRGILGWGKSETTVLAQKEVGNGNANIFFIPINADSAILNKTIPLRDKTGIPMDEAALGREGVGAAIDYDGTRIMAAWRYISDLDLGLVVKINRNEAFASAIVLGREIAAGILIIAILVVGAALFLASTISKPIRKLSETAEKINKGDFKLRTSILATDEIGELADNFNMMTDSLVATREAIREEKNKLQNILESMGDGAFAVNAVGYIVFFNPVMQLITDYKSAEVIGGHHKQVFKFILEEKRSEAREFVEICLKTGLTQVIAEKIIVVGKNNKETAVGGVVSPIKDDKDNIMGAVVILRDLTKERELEKTKINFVSIASHQLRTPLSAMRWTLESLMEKETGPLQKKQKEYLNNTYKSTRKLIELVDILLLSSRIEEGRFFIQPALTNLVKTTEEVLLELSALIKAKNFDVAITGNINAIPEIILGEEMFKQVVLNLISNSIHYTPDNGKITINFELQPEAVRVSVADNGIGIPKDVQHRIFEKFFRAEKAIAMSPEGTGMGLNLAKTLVTMWGGKIWFESEEDRGATFFFTVPLIGTNHKKQL